MFNPIISKLNFNTTTTNVSNSSIELINQNYITTEELELAYSYLDSIKLLTKLGAIQKTLATQNNPFYQVVSPTWAEGQGIQQVPLKTGSGFSDRVITDDMPDPLIVLHHSGDFERTSTFLKSYTDRAYHALVDEKGKIYQYVAWNKSAWGSGRSAFNGESYRNSVDNFAINISLTESKGTGPRSQKDYNTELHYINPDCPLDYYPEVQYRALATLVSKMGVPISRITSHRRVASEVGRTNRGDPRCFDWNKFKSILSQLPSKKEIVFGFKGQ